MATFTEEPVEIDEAVVEEATVGQGLTRRVEEFFKAVDLGPVDLYGLQLVEQTLGSSGDKCVAAALDWVNMVRGEYGLEPLDELLPGDPGEPGSCVLARSVAGVTDGSCPLPESGGRHAGNGLVFSREGHVHRREIPGVVQEFMGRFDAGLYPTLIRLPVGVGVFVTAA